MLRGVHDMKSTLGTFSAIGKVELRGESLGCAFCNYSTLKLRLEPL